MSGFSFKKDKQSVMEKSFYKNSDTTSKMSVSTKKRLYIKQVNTLLGSTGTMDKFKYVQKNGMRQSTLN
jgi:hypothetical protein